LHRNVTREKALGSETPTAVTQFSAASPAAENDRAQRFTPPSTPIFASPWFWLVIAVITGAIAIALQRRLRSA
jgi:hypothetical protein